jgi:glutamate racemase
MLLDPSMSNTSTKPIGVFDSGLGGLTVLKELVALMPNENFIYLGDVARLPYGTKSSTVVTRYASRCVDYLVGRDVKLVVIACNTATATALPELRRERAFPIHGVIEPGVSAALAHTRKKKVLVLATPSTVKSDAYPKEFRRQDPSVSVEQLACPLLVPLAEEGWFDHEVTVSVMREYMARARDPEFDTVVLGCTHYPLLLPSLSRALGPGIRLVHGGANLAAQVKIGLQASHSLRSSSQPGSIDLVATDVISSTVPLVQSLFGPHCNFSLVDL